MAKMKDFINLHETRYVLHNVNDDDDDEDL